MRLSLPSEHMVLVVRSGARGTHSRHSPLGVAAMKAYQFWGANVTLTETESMAAPEDGQEQGMNRRYLFCLSLSMLPASSCGELNTS